jgi:hypothetical protein
VLCLRRSRPLLTLTLRIPTQIPPPLPKKVRLTTVVADMVLVDAPPGLLPVQGVDPGTDVVLRSGQFLDL